MKSLLPLAAVAATLALTPAAALAGTASPQFAGDPLTYLRAGQPATSLTTAFQLNQPLGAGSSVAVQTAGGSVLATATPKVLGKSGLCYSATFALPSAVASGSVLSVVLTPAGGAALAPNAELIRLLSVKQQRNVAATVGQGSC